MNITAIANSTIGPFLGALIGKLLSRPQAYRLSDSLTKRAASRENSNIYRAIRSNQAVVQDLPYESPELEGVVERVLQRAGRGLADFFTALGGGLEKFPETISIEDHLIEDAKRSHSEGKGIMLCGLHMSSFNLILLDLVKFGVEVQVLSFANPGGGYKSDNYIRRRYGAHVTPITTQSLREAVRRLKNNGLVMTAVDRPDVGGEKLNFFGRPTEIAVGHARMAVMTGADVIVGVCTMVDEGKYIITGPPIIRPEITGDVKADSLRLAQQIVDKLEGYIRDRPEEWVMYFPLWPEEIPPQEN